MSDAALINEIRCVAHYDVPSLLADADSLSLSSCVEVAAPSKSDAFTSGLGVIQLQSGALSEPNLYDATLQSPYVKKTSFRLAVERNAIRGQLHSADPTMQSSANDGFRS